MTASALDRARLHEALALAERSIGLSEPNPRVGCVIGLDSGEVFGRGFTQEAGGPHAEVMALRDARAAGRNPRGATAWVTLEPCAHHGRTPPCCDALLEAGIVRVVVATVDPFDQVAGAGLARLRAAGVRVQMADADIAEQAREINIGFFSRIERRRPWVRLKTAISLDGMTALADGSSQWITGPAARTDGHLWRRRAGAVLTGVGTALADDPRLDVRLVPTQVQPLRVVLDPSLRLPPCARLLASPGRARLYTLDAPAPGHALADAGAEIAVVPAAVGTAGGPAGGVSLPHVLADLADHGINELHVEAGRRLSGAFLAAGLVDELLVYLAPRLLGPGLGMAALPALSRLADAWAFRFVDCSPVGDDLRLRLRPAVGAIVHA